MSLRTVRLQSAALLLACATYAMGATPARRAAPRPATGPTAVAVESNKPYVHEGSRFTFPPSLGAFARVRVYRVDTAGEDVTVAYRDPDLKIVATVSVYPTLDVPPTRHFEAVKREMARLHPKARVAAEGEWKLRQPAPRDDPEAGAEADGLRAVYEYIGPLNGVEQDLTTELYLLSVGRHFVKYRLTYPTADARAAGVRAKRFLEVLTLPEADTRDASRNGKPEGNRDRDDEVRT